tara:strand:- start:447 stop:791 length:345 start_codon:yes stop_codon:yes gene_type:complete
MSKMTQTIKTMWKQMGGYNRLNAMLGLKYPTYSDEKRQIMFRWKAKSAVKLAAVTGGNKAANYVVITLDASDTYSMKFKRIHGLNCTDLVEFSGIYADQLKSIFENSTGLALSL